MKTVLYEERISHRLMTFDDMRKKWLQQNSLREGMNLDDEVKYHIVTKSVLNGGFILQITGDFILDWCNNMFDSVEGSELLSQEDRDTIIRNRYEIMRGRILNDLSNLKTLQFCPDNDKDVEYFKDTVKLFNDSKGRL